MDWRGKRPSVATVVPDPHADDERTRRMGMEERRHARQEALRDHVVGDVGGVGLAVDVQRAQVVPELADRYGRLGPLPSGS
jgi:hypothetical protein